jgi:hypothetical protein
MPVPLIVEGLPPHLLRGWTSVDHADAFLRSGHLRLRRVQYYRTIELADRVDDSEGEGHLLVPGNPPVITLDATSMQVIDEHAPPGHFNFIQSFLNPTYVFCSSDIAVGIAESLGAARMTRSGMNTSHR